MTKSTKKKVFTRKLLGRLLPPLIILLGLIVVAVIHKLPVEKDEPMVIPSPPVNVTVLPVTVIPTVPDEFVLDAIVEPNRVVNVAAEVDGRVERYGQLDDRQLQEGDFVQAGTPLLYLNTDLLQAAYNRAQAQYDFDLRNFDRIEDAQKKNVATRKELDQANTDLALSKATLDDVKAKLDRTTILAPISGKLDRLPVEIGEYVLPGIVCAQIVDKQTVKIVANISEQDIAYFQVGQQQKIFVNHNGRPVTLDGKITYISDVAEQVAHTTRVEIAVPNQDDRFQSGQFVTVRLKRQDRKNVIMVPLDAIIPLENGYMVYIVEHGKAQPRYNILIDILSIKGKQIRVTDGLSGGEQLIVKGNWLCGPGQNVNILTSESDPEPDPENVPLQDN